MFKRSYPCTSPAPPPNHRVLGTRSRHAEFQEGLSPSSSKLVRVVRPRCLLFNFTIKKDGDYLRTLTFVTLRFPSLLPETLLAERYNLYGTAIQTSVCQLRNRHVEKETNPPQRHFSRRIMVLYITHVVKHYVCRQTTNEPSQK